MNRYRFRLETVRRVRRVQEDLAIGAWRIAQGELRTADAAVGSALDHYRSQAMAARAMTATAFLAGHERASRAADLVISSQATRTIASGAVDERRAEWSVAARRVAGLDKLDDHKRNEHSQAAARGEAVIDDDRAAVAFRARHETQKGSR